MRKICSSTICFVQEIMNYGIITKSKGSIIEEVICHYVIDFFEEFFDYN